MGPLKRRQLQTLRIHEAVSIKLCVFMCVCACAHVHACQSWWSKLRSCTHVPSTLLSHLSRLFAKYFLNVDRPSTVPEALSSDHKDTTHHWPSSIIPLPHSLTGHRATPFSLYSSELTALILKAFPLFANNHTDGKTDFLKCTRV